MSASLEQRISLSPSPDLRRRLENLSQSRRAAELDVEEPSFEDRDRLGRRQTPRRRVASLTLLLLLALAPGGCRTMTRQQLAVTRLAPAASGFLQIRDLGHNRLHLLVEARMLPEPRLILPLSNVYVVWCSPLGARDLRGLAIRLGRLDLRGRHRHGLLTATTELSRFQLFVTVEPYPDIPEPSGPVVLAGMVRWR